MRLFLLQPLPNVPRAPQLQGPPDGTQITRNTAGFRISWDLESTVRVYRGSGCDSDRAWPNDDDKAKPSSNALALTKSHSVLF